MLKNKLRKNYMYKYYTSMLYLNSIKYSSNNIIGLSNILNKVFDKKVIIRIINLKYLFLDNTIIADAVVRKLNDRNKRILKVIRKAIKLVRKAKLNPMLLIPRRIKINNDNNTINNKNITDNANNNRKFAITDLHNKFLTGIRLEGSGRLTKRLTASRSVFKHNHKGSLKNINSSFQKNSSIILKGYEKSNIQYMNINSYNRNGSFGIKS
jgi:hypothetical protein